MRFAKLFFVLLGLGLLAAVVSQTNVEELLGQMRRLSWPGMVVVMGLYVVSFWTDVASWQLTLPVVNMGLRWTARLYVVRMIGEAYNNITPMASMGGEPIKAWMLKHNYGVSYRDSGASLVLAKTTMMFSLAAFVGIGFIMIMLSHQLSVTQKSIAGFGLLGLIIWIIVFVLMQRLKLSSFTASRLSGTRFGGKLSSLVAAMHDLDVLFARFYAEHRKRLLLSSIIAFFNWILGALEIYWIMIFIGHPVTWSDAWIIESMVQLVRTATFFIPAGIGTQEGTLLLMCAALTGNPSLAVTVALVRRCRELIWIAISLALASWYSVSPRVVSSGRFNSTQEI